MRRDRTKSAYTGFLRAMRHKRLLETPSAKAEEEEETAAPLVSLEPLESPANARLESDSGEEATHV
jgi:hypothetical protein